MSILGQEPITLRSFAAGSRNALGRWAEGASTDTVIQASVQPAKGQDMTLLPEGSRQSDSKRVYTTSALVTDNQHDGRSADQLVIDTIVYQVMSVKRERSIIPHYRAICLRVTEA